MSGTRISRVALVCSLLCTTAMAAEPDTVEENMPAMVGDDRQLFVDRVLIGQMDGVTLRLHEPVPGGVAIALDRPWEGPANFGISVIPLDGRYLMYYRAMTLAKEDLTGVLCVALSNDGVTWTKPGLGLVERDGRGDTNIIADESGNPLMMDPWLDTRPGVPIDERVKALVSEPLSGEKHTAFKNPKGPKRLAVWTSSDGFTFRKLVPQPTIISHLPNCFDGGNTMFWSEAEQAYALYYRIYEGDGGRGRTMARTTSKDFLNWSEPVAMTYGNTPPEQFYTNNTQPYFRAPHIYVALAARFMEGRGVLTEQQAERIGLESAQGHSYVNDCSDGVLLTSRAGSTQYDRTFMEAFVRPGPGPENWVSRTNYPLTGILPYGPDHMMFWVSRHYMQDTWHIERQILRLDGFVSVNAPHSGGEMLTRPLVFAGKDLELNFRTSAAGYVCVEIQDGAGRALSGYSIKDCPEIIGDEVARTVSWGKGTDVSQLAGQTVQLRFIMKDADLYSFRFRKDDGG